MARAMPPLRLAIVGGGPSAFYVASRLLSRSRNVSVHIYDKLWAPHGLVRYGVAPDHPEVKVSHPVQEKQSALTISSELHT